VWQFPRHFGATASAAQPGAAGRDYREASDRKRGRSRAQRVATIGKASYP
jgi:hypothetical protein